MDNLSECKYSKKILSCKLFPENFFVCEKKLYICIEKAKG